MSNANTPAMMAQSMAESLLRENKALKEQNAQLIAGFHLQPKGATFIEAYKELQEQNALLTVQVQRLETAIAPLAECHLPPDGCENLGVTAHFYTGEVVAAKAALTALPQQE